MLFTARSDSFFRAGLTPLGEFNGVVRSLGRANNRPWFIATYLHCDGAFSYWETVCTAHEDDLVQHIEQNIKARIAVLHYMEPPNPERPTSWRCHTVRMIEKGRYQESEVSIYTLANMDKRCVEFPEARLEHITNRRIVLEARQDHFY